MTFCLDDRSTNLSSRRRCLPKCSRLCRPIAPHRRGERSNCNFGTGERPRSVLCLISDLLRAGAYVGLHGSGVGTPKLSPRELETTRLGSLYCLVCFGLLTACPNGSKPSFPEQGPPEVTYIDEGQGVANAQPLWKLRVGHRLLGDWSPNFSSTGESRYETYVGPPTEFQGKSFLTSCFLGRILHKKPSKRAGLLEVRQSG